MSEIEGSLAGLTRVLLKGIGELPEAAAPSVAPQPSPVAYEPRFEDVNAGLDNTMDNYRSRMGLPPGWNGEEEETPPYEPMPDMVSDFTLNASTLTGLKKLRELRHEPLVLQDGAAQHTLGRYDQNHDQVLDEGELNQLLGDMASGEFDPTRLVRIDNQGIDGIGAGAGIVTAGAMSTLQSLHDRYETLDRMSHRP